MNLDHITEKLLFKDGIFFAKEDSKVSYPSDGNDICFAVEDRSFWFKHRADCIAEAVRNFPSDGMIFDIGGGNGHVSKVLEKSGFETVLVEPGIHGVLNAKQRGLKHLICATIESADFPKGSLPAVGIFDVLEHNDEDGKFLVSIWEMLKPDGMLYLTVPAYQFLWSAEDVFAGHFRRYSLNGLKRQLEKAGFKISYATYIFSFLPVFILFLRVIPSIFGFKKEDPAKESSNDLVVQNKILKFISDKVFQIESGFVRNKKKNVVWRDLSSCSQGHQIKKGIKLPEPGLAASPYLSVVIPVYKAEQCLDELYRRLKISLESITPNFEIILVEDCGGDNSWTIIKQLALADPRVRGIQFSRNFGQHYGITAGLDHCHGDWVVVMDCDLQDRPEEIPRLYAKAQEGYEVVLARRGTRRDPLLKRITADLFYRLFSYLADINYDGASGNFRIISKKVVVNLCVMHEQLRSFGGLVHWMGFPTASIEVEHDKRFKGKSSYTISKLLKLATETIIAHSDKPLRFAVQFGFIMAFFAFCFGIYILIRAMKYGIAVQGWSSLIVSIYFIGGIIITILGIIGIYLGKTFGESKKRPLYIIDKTTSSKE